MRGNVVFTTKHRSKNTFKRQKIILFLDALYATESVFQTLNTYRWQGMITLPTRKLKHLAKALRQKHTDTYEIPHQPYYRQRHQQFYWANNQRWNDENTLTVHLIACVEHYETVDPTTGDIKTHTTEKNWISTQLIKLEQIHELCNLGARKKELIEDSMNTEKNRGYHYTHAFAYQWNAMQNFHYLMRLAHAINALSEFTKYLKKYVKSLGVSATHKLIKETLFSPWLPITWYHSQRKLNAQLRLQLE